MVSNSEIRNPKFEIRVRVPATTANLGPGFDCLGLALDWWNTLDVETIPRGLEIECSGAYAAEVPRDASNLVIRAMRATFVRARRKMPAVRVKMRVEIPIGRGLGSSAAAIVGGVVAANALMRGKMKMPELLELATEIEGHPDNVAPALLGGLVVAVQDGKNLIAARVNVPRELKCIVFVPDHALSTKTARGVLPARVPRADAIFNVGRAALWLAAVKARRWEWLDAATQDRLHQPYRAKLVRGMEAMFIAAHKAGARGVALSGAGPSVIAFTERGSGRIAWALNRAAADIALNGAARVVAVSARGALVKKI
ncbi:MAG: homoserine kinase [Chloroflexi bacterium]|nr:homoserine kinase [Chloroflexota bacterium]